MNSAQFVRVAFFYLPLLFNLVSCDRSQHFDDTLQATLWMQRAGEYYAACLQTYRSASSLLPIALKDSTWTAALEQKDSYFHLPPAIILDIDQTLLDNSFYKTLAMRKKVVFDAQLWYDWLQSATVPPIAGAVEFTNYARQHGVTIFYVTNRRPEFAAATRENLQRYGFPVDSSREVILTKMEKSMNSDEDKTSRREWIAQNYRILLLIGDDLNDFVPAMVSAEARLDLVRRYHEYWGQRWILLPNPLYGSWEQALYNFRTDLSTEEKLRIKLHHLKHPD